MVPLQGFIRVSSFRKLGGIPYFGVLIIRVLLFRVLQEGSLFRKLPYRVKGLGPSLGFSIVKIRVPFWVPTIRDLNFDNRLHIGSRV